ncbi:PLP-dependent aspartate aminotransferase family protein [Rhodobiaceae bacterium]|jgi:cystathionine beta-lyase/cystathionine gamma-synthase|nr:PLP-dependent aspartate aminotransferase family protein [Rhodobiaceae bacterium]
MNKEKKGFDTRAIHAGQKNDPVTGAVMTPIYATSTYAQESPGVHKGYEYSRTSNPTRKALEDCIASLENGDQGFAFASGMAATSTILELLDSGDHVIASDDLYGGTYRLMEDVRKRTSSLDFSFVDFSKTSNILDAIKPNTKMLWLETPSNPLLKITDLEEIVSAINQKNIIKVCDNTFSSPRIQQPLDFGFDIVMHSATKYIGGHSDVVAGLAVTSKDRSDLSDRLAYLINASGGMTGPFDSFMLLRSLKTLSIRMEKHSENAQLVAEFLENHPLVSKTIYPGLQSHPEHNIAKKQMKLYGGMVTFVVSGGLSQAKKVLENLKIFTLAESLGGAESLAEHPAIMTHASIPKETREALGIDDGLIRLSVGIETAEDLINDLKSALD